MQGYKFYHIHVRKSYDPATKTVEVAILAKSRV